MSNPLKPGDWVELLKPIKDKPFQPGSRGQVYGVSGALVGVNFTPDGSRDLISTHDRFKKLPHNKLFPVRYRLIEV